MSAHSTSPPPNNVDNDEQPAAKRRRITLACGSCRTRKSRCNGSQPTCAACARLGFECVYEHTASSKNVIIPRETISALSQRLSELEQTMKRYEANQVRDEEGKEGDDPDEDGVSQVDLDAHTKDPIHDGIQGSLDDGEKTDGMAISFVAHQDCGFFGPSSNIAFMRDIFRAMSSKSTSSNLNIYESGLVRMSHPVLPASTQATRAERYVSDDLYSLPRDDKTCEALHTYFSSTGLIYPIIHKDSFLKTYAQVKKSHDQSQIRRTWLGLLHMILAMAVWTQAGSGTEDHDQLLSRSQAYYYRARRLFKTQMLHGTTLETVQYLLLMSLYLQGTHDSVQTWMSHGLAVRAAFSIGLHSNDVMSKFPPLEQEMRKRTWLCCVLLDRSLSMTFGRPCTIANDYCLLDVARSISVANGLLAVRNDHEETSVAFYNATFSLYNIIWKIISTIYGNNLSYNELSLTTEAFSRILSLEKELADWRAQLPIGLAIYTSAALPSSDNLGDPILEKLRIVLSLRYLNTKLLLYRFCIKRDSGINDTEFKTLNGPHRTSTASLLQAFQRAAGEAAQESINIVFVVLTRRGLGRHLIGAWWFNVYYVFNASLAIFAGLLISSQESNGVSEELARLERGVQYLDRSVEALRRLNPRSPVLLRCVDYVSQLSSVAQSWASVVKSTGRVGDGACASSEVTAPQTTGNNGGADVLLNTQISDDPYLDVCTLENIGLDPPFVLDHPWVGDFDTHLQHNIFI